MREILNVKLMNTDSGLLWLSGKRSIRKHKGFVNFSSFSDIKTRKRSNRWIIQKHFLRSLAKSLRTRHKKILFKLSGFELQRQKEYLWPYSRSARDVCDFRRILSCRPQFKLHDSKCFRSAKRNLWRFNWLIFFTKQTPNYNSLLFIIVQTFQSWIRRRGFYSRRSSLCASDICVRSRFSGLFWRGIFTKMKLTYVHSLVFTLC